VNSEAFESTHLPPMSNLQVVSVLSVTAIFVFLKSSSLIAIDHHRQPHINWAVSRHAQNICSPFY
jgi:hypothetical protein